MHLNFNAQHLQDQLKSQGYLVLKKVLNPDKQIAAYQKAFIQRVDQIAETCLQERPISLPQAYANYPFAERFAIAIGLTAGQIYAHFTPAFNLQFADFIWHSQWPSGQFPELFDFITAPEILDILEQVMGGEITSSALTLMNFKLNSAQLDLAKSIADQLNLALLTGWRYQFFIEKTPWHRDVNSYPKDCYQSEIYTLWIPLSEANPENGCLQVVPGSHQIKMGERPVEASDISEAIPLPAEVGDLVLLDRRLIHGSLMNQTTKPRWSINFRYLPNDQPDCRPFLPRFIARSRKNPAHEMRSASLWHEIWNRSLHYHALHGIPLDPMQIKQMSLAEATQFGDYWRQLTPDPESWLSLI